MAETLQSISVAAFVLAVGFLIIAVFLWFHFKIPMVYNDLTGRTAKKSIEKFRKTNERAGRGAFQPHTGTRGRPGITSSIGPANRNPAEAGPGQGEETTLLGTSIPIGSQETELLNPKDQPVAMSGQTPNAFGHPAGGRPMPAGPNDFVILEENILSDTNDVIQ